MPITITDLFKNAQEPHSSRGFANGGQGVAKQLMDRWVRNPDELPYGRFAKGKEGHKFFQNAIFPAGKVFTNLELPGFCEDEKITLEEIEILGHEQNIMFRLDGYLRKSDIDTKVYNIAEDCLEVWDYKFNSSNTYKWLGVFVKKYGKVKPVDNVYREQANLYCDLLTKTEGAFLNIPVKRYRIICVEDSHWEHLKIFTGDYDPAMAAETMMKIELTHLELKSPGSSGVSWHELATCIDWQYCDYCHAKKECLQRFQQSLQTTEPQNLSDVRKILKIRGQYKPLF